MCLIEEDELGKTNTRGHVYDSDCEASYPSDTQAANVSRETTRRELISIEGMDKKEFKLQNINLFFGPVNTIDYCSTMLNFPTLIELEEKNKRDYG